MQLQVYLTLLLVVVSVRPSSSSVEYEFTTLDWDWASDQERTAQINSGQYVPERCIPSGIKATTESRLLFLTVPRVLYTDGVPSSLNIVDRKGYSMDAVLRPYPDWDTNKLGNCSGLQLAMSMDIDPKTDYMYVIDAGRVGIFSPTPSNLCPAKILVLDTSNGGKIVSTHEFPDSVVSRTSNFLNDIVLDYVDPDHVTGVRYAYITDLLGEQIVVYDFRRNSSWSFKHPESMSAGNGRTFTINGEQYNFTLGVNGIALSPSCNYLYYSTVSSKKLWQIPTWVLRNKNADFSKYVRLVGHKKSSSDAMLFGHYGLYYGALEHDALYRWELQKDLLNQGVSEGEVTLRTETLLAQNWETMQWPDGLSFVYSNYLDSRRFYFLTTRSQLALSGTLDFSGKNGPNFKIFSLKVQDTSYLTSS